MIVRVLVALHAGIATGVIVAGCTSAGLMTDADSATSMSAERQIIVAVRSERPRVQRRAGSTSRPYGAAQYRGSLDAQRKMAVLARRYDLHPVHVWPIDLLELHCVVFEIPAHRSRDELLAAIAADPDVELVQPMQTFTAMVQGGNEHLVGLQTSIVAMDVIGAHRWATGKGVRVAVIDTGIDAGHPGLEGRVLEAMDFTGRYASGAAVESHGLAVAGVIAGRANAPLGTVGVAPGSALLLLRACWHTDTSTAVCNTFTLARAIAAAAEKRAAVINLSLAGPADTLLTRLLQQAMNRGIIVVGAASDCERCEPRQDNGAIERFPTSVEGVISVRSAELSDSDSPEYLQAPGQNILTLGPGGGYRLASGSSLATAHVSGVVALLLEHHTRLGADEARQLLLTHTRPVVNDGRRVFNAVNACLALAALLGERCPDDSGPAVRTLRTAPQALLSE